MYLPSWERQRSARLPRGAGSGWLWVALHALEERPCRPDPNVRLGHRHRPRRDLRRELADTSLAKVDRSHPPLATDLRIPVIPHPGNSSARRHCLPDPSQFVADRLLVGLHRRDTVPDPSTSVPNPTGRAGSAGFAGAMSGVSGLPDQLSAEAAAAARRRERMQQVAHPPHRTAARAPQPCNRATVQPCNPDALCTCTPPLLTAASRPEGERPRVTGLPCLPYLLASG